MIIFKLVENDVSTVTVSDIMAILPNPVQVEGDSEEYEFSPKVDVKKLGILRT